MAEDKSDEFLQQDPSDKLRVPSNSPFSLPGDEEPPAAGLEGMLVQAEIDAHIFDLKTLEKNSQKKSIQKMVDLGPSAVDPLCVYLKHPDRWARMMAAEVLGKIHDPRAIPALKEALNDQHQGVRYMSELALKEIAASTNLEKSSPAKGKESQGKPPMPAKVTAKLHPVESRNRATSEKPPVAEPQKVEESEKPAATPEPKPKAASGLPEPNIPENLPEIKPLEPRVIAPPPASIPPAQAIPPSSVPPLSVPQADQKSVFPAGSEDEP
ncbi:MAG: HEAT repeat domain-containing protein, partial [Anaerolineaceae bacterium]|nr:HEAT repeat domain-containing protein [Anaerolineaceae bacterium]